MSRKAGLAKKIAHTLMAMSIVYSSGINIVINEVYAAERTENITSGGTFRENGTDGDSYNFGSPSDPVTSGEDASLTGKITAADVSANPIEIEVKGGVGGRDSGSSPQLMQGTSGGNATAKVTIDESLNSVTTGNISVTAYGGANGSAYQGVAGLAGAAAAYGLEVKHDLSITAADIIVKAENNSDYNTRVDIAAAKGADTLAVGLHADNSTVTLSGGKIKVTAKSSHSVSADNTFGAAKLSAGGNVVAYGVEVSGGTAHLNLQDIKASGIRAGSGGTAAGTDASSVKAGQGGQGGSIAVAGVHVASGRADGSIGNIIFDVDNTSYGGYGGVGKNNIGGAGGDGGAVYAAGVSVDGGEAQLTVAGMDIKVKAGSGGSVGGLKYLDASQIISTGTVQAASGKGGTALAVGVDNRGGSSNVTVTGDIKIAASGGEGGTATAVGLQNTDGSLTADVQKLEITATGGAGGAGLSTYSAINGAGADSGAAAAYGINVLGGLAENLTVAEITVQATGGTNTYKAVANGMHQVNGDGAGFTGSTGSKGGTGAAYGISNSGGSAGVTVAKITVTASGGKGGVGGTIDKATSATAAGIGGDGGDGGNAYAYGVFGTGSSSRTVLAADQIIAEATVGEAGDGATTEVKYNNGVATAGNAGVKGEEAKAYGVYAASGAVVDLSAKTGDTIKINAKAAEGTVTNDAYAVYADKGTVLFGSKAQLNWDGSSGTDNNLVTGLNNATLGFSGTSADRTVSGGKLQLTGSNAFRFTTDLANNKADSMTFDTIENNGSKQYIQIGYEEAFKNALSEADIVTINGSATVLTITNLNGQNLNNFTGQASSLDSPLERFRVTPTVDVVDNKINITEIALAKENTPSETAMVASDAQMALGSMWRIEGNNLMKRMGELRSDKEAAEGGVWARYYRGELSADSAYDREFSQDYTAFQGGIDKVQDYKGGKLYTGIAVNRIDSNTGYTAGSGDLSSTGVGVYASWLGGKGHYLDVIARGSKLTNDFKLVDLSGNAAKADYDTWAYGISAEYGYRQDLNAGWFVEPQAELNLGHIGSVDYTTSNEVSVKQDSVNSAVTRIGILGGKEFSIGGRVSNAYVKASLLHDFGGNGDATGYYGNDSLALQTGDLTGTWYEIGLGANLGIAKNSNLYFDALKTFNSTVRTDWQFNAGLRFTL